MKKQKQLNEKIYHIFLASVLLTVNLFFAIFVWFPSDLSPNFALGCITLPFILIELKEGAKKLK